MHNSHEGFQKIDSTLQEEQNDGSDSNDGSTETTPDIKYLNIAQAIDEAGGFGLFQLLYVPLIGISFIANGFFIYNLNFLTLLPTLMCPNPDGIGHRVCIDEAAHRKDTFCDENNEFKNGVFIDEDSSRTLINWMSDMNMYCTPSFQISLFGSIFFFGVLFCAIGLRFANKYGRRPALIVGCVITLLCTIGLVFINNAIARYILLFIFGVCFFRNIQSYVLATEICPKKYQLLVCSSIFAFDWIQVAILSVYFMNITRNYIYFFYGAVGVVLIMTICSLFVPESPLFLYEKGKCEIARAVVNKMSLMNGASLHKENWIFDKEELIAYAPSGNLDLVVDKEGRNISSEFKNSGNIELKPLGKGDISFATSGDMSTPAPENAFYQIRTNKQLLFNLIAITACWCCVSFNKYLISFNLKHIGGNIFVNSMLSPIADMIGHLLCVPVQRYTNTRFTFIVSLILAFVFGASLIFVKTVWLIPVLIVFSKIGLASGYSLCYYMTSECFPPLFLAFVFGFTQFLSRAFTILAFPLSELEAPIPMILFSATPIVALSLVIFVKNDQTKRMKGKFEKQESIQLLVDSDSHE
ncbi:unnamed protein product [Moneuplotes crassus]|uniref:Uncharacterized protein n=1 Tax=Euplotes crassus TaxID=5936 RepID=A0AAD1X6B5_EUPCR|nr:unnamed protein product [Moneuplotes crassus]